MSGPLPDEIVQAFLARCRAEWKAAGFPDHVEDPHVIDLIVAGIVADGRTTNHA